MTIIVIALLVLLTLLGMPLFIALAGGSLLATFNAGLDPALLAVELNRLAASPYLAAIPLFTFAGVVLAAGGAPERMIQLFNACVGWLPGGIASVAIASPTILSGSKDLKEVCPQNFKIIIECLVFTLLAIHTFSHSSFMHYTLAFPLKGGGTMAYS